jgi:hypothetical protein
MPAVLSAVAHPGRAARGRDLTRGPGLGLLSGLRDLHASVTMTP